uniref:Uncharacterized protein n=1 Tax=Sphaeramia orbicularis TaxID=375764 RepID=A0A673C9K7_9TELE
MYDGCSPIIIDNTNIQAWEMKPYVKVVGRDVLILDISSSVMSLQKNPSNMPLTYHHLRETK